MNNKSIRMVVSLSLNALFIAIAVVVVVMFGTKPIHLVTIYLMRSRWTQLIMPKWLK